MNPARPAGAGVATLLLASLLLYCAGTALAQGVLRAGDIALHYWPGQDRFAQSLLERTVDAPLPGLPADILQRGDPVRVYVAPDESRFDSLTGGRAPEWGAGVAFPLDEVIVLPGYVSGRTGTHTLPQTLRHELAHVALQRHLGNAIVPRWFTEGYATWAAGEFTDEQGWKLRLALLTGRAPRLDSLTLDWPLIAGDAETAYLLSASAVRYLASLGEAETFTRFLDAWSGNGDFEASLRAVYLLASPQFERLWRRHVRDRYGWLYIAAQTLFVWAVLSLLVVALWLIRRRRDRQRMEQLRRTEPPDEPAFWIEAGEDEETTSPGDGGPEGDPPRA